MAYLGGVLSFLALALWVFALVDSGTIPAGQARYLNKWIWFALVAVFSFVGAIAWLTLGRPRRVPAGVAGAGTGAGKAQFTPDPEPVRRPRRIRPAAVAPDDDPEFLKKLEEITDLERQAREDEPPEDK